MPERHIGLLVLARVAVLGVRAQPEAHARERGAGLPHVAAVLVRDEGTETDVLQGVLEVFLLETGKVGHGREDALGGAGAEVGVDERVELGHEVGEDAYVAGCGTAAKFVETSFLVEVGAVDFFPRCAVAGNG